MVNSSREANFWRLEGIVRRKMNVEEEDAAAVGRVVWTHDGGLPVEKIVADRPRRAVRRRVVAQLLQLAGDALQCHVRGVASRRERSRPSWGNSSFLVFGEKKVRRRCKGWKRARIV